MKPFLPKNRSESERGPRMRYYPVFIDMEGERSVVVGGGAVAERKVESLLKAGASVTVISPRATKKLRELAANGAIRLIKRNFRRTDLADENPFVVVGASGSQRVNSEVFEEAKLLKTLVNVVDNPALCNFIVPSVIERGPLIVAVSTSGKAPGLAKKLRVDLERHIGEEYATFTSIVGAVRKKLLKNGANHDKKERVIKALVDSPIPDWLRDGARSSKEINSFLKKLLGASFTLSRLGINLKTSKGPAEKR